MGGKSRKKGGISKQLVKQLMQKYQSDKPSRSSCGSPSEHKYTSDKTLFELKDKDKNESLPKKAEGAEDSP